MNIDSIFGIKRSESQRYRGMHIVDPNSGRGLFFQYRTVSKTLDAVAKRDLSKGKEEEFETHLEDKGYDPREIRIDEFERLYGKFANNLVLSKSSGELNEGEFPGLYRILTENPEEFQKGVYDLFTRMTNIVNAESARIRNNN